MVKSPKTSIQRLFASSFILFPMIVLLLNGCTDSLGDGLPGRNSNNNTYHPAGWKDNPQHGIDYSVNQQNCKACHGSDLRGGSSGISCDACHHGWRGTHGQAYAEDADNCKTCHGQDLEGGLVAPSCAGCHHRGWTGTHADAFNEDPDSCQACHGGTITECADCHHSGWSGTHGEEYAADPDNCKACHGEDLTGGDANVDCDSCHHDDAVAPWQHGDYHAVPDECSSCHGSDFNGGTTLVSCFSCHSAISAFDCSDCHTDAASSYTDSAHGNTSYGVDRSGTGYALGDCTQCHDLPAGSTNDLLLFAPVNPTSQSENFCFQCHKDPADSVQTAMLNQYNYSYRASGDATLTTPDDILEAFSFSTPATSHKLSDISTFTAGNWGYTSDSNPCTACHNPHSAGRDPHTDGDRGWPVSLPSDHTETSTWGLWGDVAEERMKQYITDQGGTYQAPNADSGYEPDGSATQDGSNLTDYVTFCTDCHNSSNTVYSSVLGRNLYTIDWDSEKHGGGAASDGAGYSEVVSPYQDAQCGSYVLACTDCHEAHGSPNNLLIRKRVNNGTVTVTNNGSGSGPDGKVAKEWMYLCGKCHSGTVFKQAHHSSGLACASCHTGDPMYRNCMDCHYHGNSSVDGVPYGEALF